MLTVVYIMIMPFMRLEPDGPFNFVTNIATHKPMKSLITLLIFLALPFWAAGEADKFRAIVNGNPSYSMTIGWNQISGHSVALFYDTVDHGQETADYGNYQLPDRTVSYKGMNNYFVRLSDLEPATNYYFIIVDSEGTSERFWFRTLPDDPEVPLSIIMGGDSRRSGSEFTPHEPRIESNRIVRAIRPDLVAFGGDYTDKDTDEQWQTWMDDWQYTTGRDGRMFPILNTRGNHERNNDVMVNLFDVPSPDVYYATTLGGNLIRFYTLNVMTSVAGNQANWLREDLTAYDDSTAWKMAQYHYSIAPHQSGKSYQTPMYLHWASLFHEFGVQLVVECDVHVAKNTFPIKPSSADGEDHGFIRDDQTGTVYTGEGSWGLIRTANVSYDWTRESGSFTQVKWMHVNQDSLVIYTIKSASSNPTDILEDSNRFRMPEGMDLWETEYGDRVVIDRPDPGYQKVVSVEEAPVQEQADLISMVFPNPVSGVLFVETHDARPSTYEVIDGVGRTLLRGRMEGASHQIRTSSLPQGNYYLRVTRPEAGLFEMTSFTKY